jgi:hypothetical protein
MDQGTENRISAFGDGIYPPSLQEKAAELNARQPRAFEPVSSLHQVIQSPNGMSAQDAPRRLLGGSMLPSSDGMSASTYEQKRPFLNPVMSA